MTSVLFIDSRSILKCTGNKCQRTLDRRKIDDLIHRDKQETC